MCIRDSINTLLSTVWFFIWTTIVSQNPTRNSNHFRVRNDLYCVGWVVKLYSPTHLSGHHVVCTYSAGCNILLQWMWRRCYVAEAVRWKCRYLRWDRCRQVAITLCCWWVMDEFAPADQITSVSFHLSLENYIILILVKTRFIRNQLGKSHYKSSQQHSNMPQP